MKFVILTVFTTLIFLTTVYYGINVFRRRRSKCLNVLSLTQFISIGGLERVVANLSLMLSKVDNCRPFVFVYDHQSHMPGFLPVLRNNNVEVGHTTKPPGLSLKVVVELSKFILNKDIHVIHTHDLNALIYGVVAKLVSFGKVKILHTQHSFVHLKKRPYYATLERIFCKFADKICVVSADLKQLYEKINVPTSNMDIVNNGVLFSDVQEYSAKQRLNARKQLLNEVADFNNARDFIERYKNKIWLLALGRIFSGKGQDHLLTIWNALADEIKKECVLIFVGPLLQDNKADGPMDFQNNLKKAALSEQILWAGPSDLPTRWYQATDLYLSASEFEGHPQVPIEAGGEGAKLFISDIPGHNIMSDYSTQFSLSDPIEAARKLGNDIESFKKDRNEFYRERNQIAQNIRNNHGMEDVLQKYFENYLKCKFKF